MKKLVFLFVIGLTTAGEAPVGRPSVVGEGQKTQLPPQIISQTREINPDGSYQWSFESENGISAQEKGQPLDIPEAPVGVTGSYSYKSLDGSEISLSYVADENGFRPTGNHLPVAPPIPVLIARALEWIAKQSIVQKRK